MTIIGNYAFDGCTGLTKVNISNLTAWYNILFRNYNSNPLYYAQHLYLNGSEIKNLVIPDGVTSIGDYAFDGCSGLTNITIPNSVRSIGDKAFSGCTGLTSITIPNSVTSIGEYAFYGCTGLTSITIPESVTSIGGCAFSGCTGLTSITIPESVTSIGESAFRNCTELTSITIPESVTSIGRYAFQYCSQLKTVINCSKLNITKGSSSYGYVACYADKVIKADTQIDDFFFEDRTDGNYLIYYIGNETELTLPENYQGGNYGIGESVFSNYSKLKNITIPNSVTSIGSAAFCGCTGLTNITIPNNVTSIGERAFAYCTGLKSITMPESVTNIGDYTFFDCTGLTSITIPNSVRSIGDYTFRNCTGLTSVTIGNSVTSIGDYAFSGCGLTSITIPNNVTSIGNSAFEDCTNLKMVFNFSNLNITKGSSNNGYVAYYADKVIKADTQIDDFFFEDRTDGNYLIYYIGNETELTLPENYQGGGYNVGESVFSNYSKLTNIIIPESVTSIGNSAFSGCSGLTNITIPNSATSIGDGAFKGCTGLTNITIPENVTSIGADAFCDCNNLTSIVWNVKSYPDPTSYEESPFYSNIGTIQEITFGEGITSIPIYLCKGMSNLKTVTFPQSLTSIRHYAFEGCTNLRIITIPENVKGIGHNAFSGCTKMRQIYCRSQEPPVCGNLALDGIDTWDCTLFVPEGADALYKAADQWKEFFFIEEITGIDTPKTDNGKNTVYDIYDMSGRTVRKDATTTDGLKAGLYIINGKKILVK